MLNARVRVQLQGMEVQLQRYIGDLLEDTEVDIQAMIEHELSPEKLEEQIRRAVMAEAQKQIQQVATHRVAYVLKAPENIGYRLRLARICAGYDQPQVARILNWKQQKVSRIELAKSDVGAADLAKLAQLYRVSADWLLGNGSK